MIGPLISDDRCICIPIVVSPAQLDSWGVFGIGGAGIWNYNNMFKYQINKWWTTEHVMLLCSVGKECY